MQAVGDSYNIRIAFDFVPRTGSAALIKGTKPRPLQMEIGRFHWRMLETMAANLSFLPLS